MAYTADRNLPDGRRLFKRRAFPLQSAIGYCAFCSSMAFVLMVLVAL
jgi:hypothetical protein